ncbi:universal stress protein A-like protein isoform X2 [Oryza glaberrima]|uniref:universal stress protein A-like protein isoform X2 n=1 Tax=Oryza glaberrima TaxID=4538 RepID=UPI00224C3E87|nr:universal stress protein A-like protein isoform X2 [Oryza glaberrima]
MEEKGASPAAAAATSGEPGAAAGTMKVVVAVDASEESLNALSWALDNVIGRRAGAVSVVVVHAQHGPDHFVYPVAAHGIGTIAYAPASAIESMRKAQEEISRKVVSRALDVCKQREVSATGAIVEGDAKEAICQAVEEMHADMLVLGSRGLGKIKRAFLGSVSDYLVHHACCPVLVVKPTKAHDK